MPCEERGSECITCHNIDYLIFTHHCVECIVCLVNKKPKLKDKIVLDIL